MAIKRIMIEETTPWQKPILSIANSGIATKGNRYIVGDIPSETFAALTPNDIAWYDGTDWQTDTPLEGWKAWDLNQGKLLTFDGSDWVSEGDLSDKMDKQGDATENELVAFDDGGNSKKSGVMTPVYDNDLGAIIMEFLV